MYHLECTYLNDDLIFWHAHMSSGMYLVTKPEKETETETETVTVTETETETETETGTKTETKIETEIHRSPERPERRDLDFTR